MIDIGKVAYEAYVTALKDKHNVETPTWEDLDSVNKSFWKTSALAVLQHKDEEIL